MNPKHTIHTQDPYFIRYTIPPDSISFIDIVSLYLSSSIALRVEDLPLLTFYIIAFSLH